MLVLSNLYIRDQQNELVYRQKLQIRNTGDKLIGSVADGDASP